MPFIKNIALLFLLSTVVLTNGKICKSKPKFPQPSGTTIQSSEKQVLNSYAIPSESNQINTISTSQPQTQTQTETQSQSNQEVSETSATPNSETTDNHEEAEMSKTPCPSQNSQNGHAGMNSTTSTPNEESAQGEGEGEEAAQEQQEQEGVDGQEGQGEVNGEEEETDQSEETTETTNNGETAQEDNEDTVNAQQQVKNGEDIDQATEAPFYRLAPGLYNIMNARVAVSQNYSLAFGRVTKKLKLKDMKHPVKWRIHYPDYSSNEFILQNNWNNGWALTRYQYVVRANTFWNHNVKLDKTDSTKWIVHPIEGCKDCYHIQVASGRRSRQNQYLGVKGSTRVKTVSKKKATEWIITPAH